MKKIDEQPDRGSHTVGGGVDASAQGAPSLPGSQAITVETAAFPSMELRSEHETSLQGVASKTTSRRAWLRRGVAVASPVVASLVSAPVYGADCLMLNASGFVSGPTFASRHPGQTHCPPLPGPNFFHANVLTSGVWPTNTTTEIFKTVFGVPVNVEIGITDTTTLDQVLGNFGGSYSDLAKYSIAAYLNVRKGTANFPFSSTQQVFDVYKSYRGGPFSTLLVTGWTEAQTVDWLRILMT